MHQNLSSIGLLVYKLQLFKSSYCKFSKIWICVLIKHCFLMGKNTVQAKQWFDKCCSDSAPLETMVKRWYADFKCGHTDTNDAELSGHPNSAVLEKNKKLQKLILANHKLKLCEIAKELKISEGSVFTILHEYLSIRKLCSKWVPHLLTVDQKQLCIDDSERCLQLFQHNKYVTIDDTWIHYFTPKSNHQSAEWTAANESCPKWQKIQTSAGKLLTSVFWDAQGILFIDYIGKRRTINSKYYIGLMVHLKEEITKKQPQMRIKKSAFSPRQCTVSQVDCNNGKTTWIALWIASALILFSRDGSQWPLAVCRLQKNAPGKEIWLQWRSDIGNWGIFWGQRQIILQKRHQIVWEALESVYHPRSE